MPEPTSLARGSSRTVVFLVAALGLGFVVVVGAFVWHRYWREPSPEALCEHLADLVREQPEAMPAARMLISPQAIGDEESPNSRDFESQCLWYFRALQREAPDSYPEAARCVADAEGKEVLGCY